MPNLLLGWPNAVTFGTLAASAQEAALPVGNLANDQGSPASALQIPATSGSFSVALAAPATWRMFGVHRTNLTTSATIRVRVWPGTDTTTAPAFDSGVVPAGIVATYGQAIVVAPADVVGQLCKVDLADPGNPDGHLNIPLAYAGSAWQPSRNMDSSSTFGRKSSAANVITRSGGVVTRSDWVQRFYTLSITALRRDEVWSRIMDLDLYARRGNNVLLVPNPTSTLIQQQAVFGQMAPQDDIGFVGQSGLYNTFKATVTERL